MTKFEIFQALLISQFLVSKGEYADYKFPLWADVIGWIISSIPGFLVLLCACYKVLDVVLRNKVVCLSLVQCIS